MWRTTRQAAWGCSGHIGGAEAHDFRAGDAGRWELQLLGVDSSLHLRFAVHMFLNAKVKGLPWSSVHPQDWAIGVLRGLNYGFLSS